jgi:ferric-dicitrate binding protein FerR (iron transport regulator)
MRNITLSAEEQLIDQARRIAQSQHKTLNQAFREWLESYARPNNALERYEALKKDLKYVRAGRKFTREEMNER